MGLGETSVGLGETRVSGNTPSPRPRQPRAKTKIIEQFMFTIGQTPIKAGEAGAFCEQRVKRWVWSGQIDNACTSSIELVAPALRMHVERDPGLLSYVTAFLLDSEAPNPLEQLKNVQVTSTTDFSQALRMLHHREIARIALREIESLADIDQTAREVSALAETLIELALENALQDQQCEGLNNAIAVIGMGKLGSRELNLSSDVDIVFVADEKLAADEDRSPCCRARRTKDCSTHLRKSPSHGICFRVDLRLRPAGNQGPLITSPHAAGRYYQSFGRPWERAALLSQPMHSRKCRRRHALLGEST